MAMMKTDCDMYKVASLVHRDGMKKSVFSVETVISASVLVALTGCQPGLVGGPCSYEETRLEGTVTAITQDGALIVSSGEEWLVPQEYVREPFEVGMDVTLIREHIREGTCTPVIYTVQKRSN